MNRRDRGQAVVLTLVAIVVAVLVAVAAAGLSHQIVVTSRASAAADAAALAGVNGGRTAAQRVAMLNGATLVSFSVDDGVVGVVVAVGSTRATARASDLP